MALRDKQRKTHSGTFIDNINSFLSYDFWIFLKPSLKGFQSCLHFVRSNGEDFNWLGILKIKQDRCPKLLRLREVKIYPTAENSASENMYIVSGHNIRICRIY